jgi:hypothetical protein
MEVIAMLQELVQQIEQTAKSVVSEVHTALPAEIVSFNPQKGFATVKPIGKYRLDDGTRIDYPIISDVPVVFPFCQSASVGMIFPIKAGDFCLLVMSEQEIDEFLHGKESDVSLQFDLTNAIAIPGLFKIGGNLLKKACIEDEVIIKANDTEVIVSKDGVSINADVRIKGNIICSGRVTTSATWEE